MSDIILSKTALETYATCQRKYKYRFIDNVAPKDAESPEMRFGTAFHGLLEQHLLGKEAQAKDAKMALLFDAYKSVYPVMKETVVAVEKQVTVTIDGVNFGVTFDALVEDKNFLYVMEHKTTKSDVEDNSFYWDKLQHDWQVGLYQLVAQHLYPEKQVAVLYNVIRVPQIRQKNSETLEEFYSRMAEDLSSRPSHYFHRAYLRWSKAQLQNLREDLAEHGKQIDWQTTSSWFPKSRRGCFDYRRVCEYYKTCFEDVPLTDESLYVKEPNKYRLNVIA